MTNDIRLITISLPSTTKKKKKTHFQMPYTIGVEVNIEINSLNITLHLSIHTNTSLRKLHNGFVILLRSFTYLL